MKLLFQPEGSRTCGQHCVAMICEVTPEEVIEVCERKGSTSSKDLIKALQHFGMSTSTITKFKSEAYIGETALMLITWPCKGSHWAVYHDGLIYDPAFGVSEFKNRHYFKMEKGICNSIINVW